MSPLNGWHPVRTNPAAFFSAIGSWGTLADNFRLFDNYFYPESSLLTAFNLVMANENVDDRKKEVITIDTLKRSESEPKVDDKGFETPEKEMKQMFEKSPDSLAKRGSWTETESITSSPRHAKMLYKTRTMSALPLSTTKKSPFESQILASLKKRSFIENYEKNNLENDEEETALYFKLLFFGCTCVLIWKHIWLLPMMLFFLGIHVVKRMLVFFGVSLFFKKQYGNVMNKFDSWWRDRQSAIVPAHVRGICKMLSVLNSNIRSAAYDSVDSVSSCIVITGLILFVICASIFICIQIYSEAIVVLQLSGSVLNSTIVQNSELHAYLPEGWEEKVDSLIDDAYTYGREGISKAAYELTLISNEHVNLQRELEVAHRRSQPHRSHWCIADFGRNRISDGGGSDGDGSGIKNILVEGDPEKIARVEQQVLELWDRIYQSWVSGHFQSNGPQVDSAAVQDSWDSFITNVTKTPGIFDYSGIIAWVQANVGTLTAIASSVWAPLASNMSLLAGSLGTFASVVLCSGGAILNFILSLVIFFTTLFYLLASSNNLYKPVELITQIQPNFGPKLGTALTVAINQVFRASFKMALFYGLWTWLVHNLFGAKVVYLPSAVSIEKDVVKAYRQRGRSALEVASGSRSVYETTIHLKDYHSAHSSVTVRDCKHVKVVLDCISLQRLSRLKHLLIKDCDKLEFASVAVGALSQSPSQFTIDNVKEVKSIPGGFFKSPATSTQRKCLGVPTLKSFTIRNSKVNLIKEGAIYNATGVQKIEFNNVTIDNIEKRAIDAIMVGRDTSFTIDNTKIDNLKSNSVVVVTKTATITGNTFGSVLSYSVNITADSVKLSNNMFNKIEQSGLSFRGTAIDIVNNSIDMLSSNALADIKCSRRKSSYQYLNFSNNTIRNVEPYSLWFDHASCKNSDGVVTVRNNKIRCKCQDISFLTMSNPIHQDLNNLFLDPNNNNTCLSAPCLLPIEVVKILTRNHMCQLDLNPQVTCMLYYDNKRNVTETIVEDEETTEPAPTFYLIRQASVPSGDAGVALTAMDRDDLLRASNLNVTNRTMIRVVFDSSRDFVDTLRSTSISRSRHDERPRPAEDAFPVARCTGSRCRNVANDRQKALDFYKYVYAQLRLPRPDVNKNSNR
ncbi:Transmembrane protein 245 [Eumeta japonica]|uniref:Transmembrane protein 245 n=1 Tax=Eumeta variegata TaxID=151549 RepID=A0A4C1VXY3_EUMVA|nr:Transmembrane protein 245 [Eumeta japonica]